MRLNVINSLQIWLQWRCALFFNCRRVHARSVENASLALVSSNCLFQLLADPTLHSIPCLCPLHLIALDTGVLNEASASKLIEILTRINSGVHGTLHVCRNGDVVPCLFPQTCHSCFGATEWHTCLHPRRNTKTGDNQENDQACSSAPVVLVATQTRLIQKITLAGLWWSCRRPCTLGLPPTTRTPASRALRPARVHLLNGTVTFATTA
mmetsp:Transcript_20817/g.30561  ORF Transcript_20817/g.30561 Transcript_20817/m.30561 type:complete len:209 (-) Transcript_20817:77-703(-)